ncbi:MAG TPA: hypothetical protein VEI03_02240 [Stellaceae bacterium]|nr:hypothetical protein [Stellaceae bacterium]
MDIDSLRNYLERPEVLRRILAGYSGPYSLGIGKGPSIVLQVESTAESRFPLTVDLGGEEVPLIVKRNFKVPAPLKAVAR